MTDTDRQTERDTQREREREEKTYLDFRIDPLSARDPVPGGPAKGTTSERRQIGCES